MVKNIIVVDDQEVSISRPLFSPDEQLLLYSQYTPQNKEAAIHILSADSLQKIIDVPLPGFSVVGEMKFSDDGKYLYFKGWQERKIVFVTVTVDTLIKEK